MAQWKTEKFHRWAQAASAKRPIDGLYGVRGHRVEDPCPYTVRNFIVKLRLNDRQQSRHV